MEINMDIVGGVEIIWTDGNGGSNMMFLHCDPVQFFLDAFPWGYPVSLQKTLPSLLSW